MFRLNWVSDLKFIFLQRVFDLSVDWGWGLGYPLFMTVVICTILHSSFVHY
jgi:hypothetical protein